MRIENEVKLDFCDVLIRPKRSKSPSRKSVDLNKKYIFLNSNALWTGLPIIASNMDTTGTFAMANVLRQYNALTALHKHYTGDQLVEFYNDIWGNRQFAWYTMGIKDDDFVKLQHVLGRVGELFFINIDVANGYTEFFVDKIKQVRQLLPYATIMAGNVCTPDMVQELLLSGADIVKIGIGPGSVCTTRIQTGVGYPQLSSIIECADAAHGLKGHICADGGCTTPGDVVKAFAGGADFVMLGGMLSGHDECEGEWEEEGEVIWEKGKAPVSTGRFIKKSLRFYGMSSQQAMDKYSGGKASYKTSEGKCVEVPYKGPVVDTLQDIMGGLRSACTYVGTESLRDLSKCTTFVRVNRTHNNVYGG